MNRESRQKCFRNAKKFKSFFDLCISSHLCFPLPPSKSSCSVASANFAFSTDHKRCKDAIWPASDQWRALIILYFLEVLALIECLQTFSLVLDFKYYLHCNSLFGESVLDFIFRGILALVFIICVSPLWHWVTVKLCTDAFLFLKSVSHKSYICILLNLFPNKNGNVKQIIYVQK